MTEQSDKLRVVIAVDRRFPNDHSFLEGVLEKRAATRIDICWIMRPSAASRQLIKSRWITSQCVLLPTNGKSGNASLLSDYWMLAKNLREVKRHVDAFSPDAIFVRNDPIYLLVALIYALRQSIPVVFQLSHLKEEELLERASRQAGLRSLLTRIKALTARSIRDFGMRRCEELYPISDAMADYLRTRLPPDCRMFTLPMGVDSLEQLGAGDCEPDQTDANCRFPERYILYVGTLAESRQPELMVHAFEQVATLYDDLALVLVGGGAEPGSKLRLQEYVQQTQVKERVIFVDDVPRRALAPIIRSSACCLSVQPSSGVFTTISPTKLMEYLQFGAPVVASEGVQDQEEIIGRSDGGRLVKFDATSIATGIRWILDNPGKARDMAARGQEYIVAHRNYDVLARELVARLKKIADETIDRAHA